jgi:hypothetical protein
LEKALIKETMKDFRVPIIVSPHVPPRTAYLVQSSVPSLRRGTVITAENQPYTVVVSDYTALSALEDYKKTGRTLTHEEVCLVRQKIDEQTQEILQRYMSEAFLEGRSSEGTVPLQGGRDSGCGSEDD